MSTTFSTTNATTTSTVSTDVRPTRISRTGALWVAGLASGAIAAVATTLMVAVARALDVPVAVDGEEIPLLGFAQLTMVGAVIGTVLAILLAKRAARPRRTFVVTTVALTAASLVPDLLVEATAGSKLVLMATHVVAAAIVVPALARRIAD